MHVVPRPFSISSTDFGYQSIVVDHWRNISISNASQTELLRTSRDDKLCSAAKMDSSLSQVFFFPIPCDVPLNTRLMCQRVSKMPKYDTMNCLPELTSGHCFGTVQIDVNSQTLVLSPINCPSQYNIYWAKTNKCIKLVHPQVSSDIYGNCVEQTAVTNKCFFERKVAPDILIENAMNTVCKTDNDNAKVFEESFNVTYGCSGQNLLSLIHDTFGVILHSFNALDASILHMITKADDNRFGNCTHCMFHGHVGSKTATNPLIACATELEVPSEHPIPDAFDPYLCSDGSLIAMAQYCDGTADCSSEEDEANCNSVCSKPAKTCFSQCKQPHCVCNDYYYMCDEGGCLHFDKLCDGKSDCEMADDEMGCLDAGTTLLLEGSQFTNIQGDNYVLNCNSGGQVYSVRAICYYDTVGDKMAHCEDGTHLGAVGACMDFACFQAFKCSYSYCIPIRKICDGVTDCPGQEDETKCEYYTCPGHLKCTNQTFCVPRWEYCVMELNTVYMEMTKSTVKSVLRDVLVLVLL